MLIQNFALRCAQVLLVFTLFASEFSASADPIHTSRDPNSGKITSVYYSRNAVPRALAAHRSGISSAELKFALIAQSYSVGSFDFIAVRKSDDASSSSERFGQYIYGISVFGSQALVTREPSGEIRSIVAHVSEVLPQDVVPQLAENEAEALAKKAFAFEAKSAVARRGLVYFDRALVEPLVNTPTVLAWHFIVEDQDGTLSKTILIDAQTGAVLYVRVHGAEALFRAVYDCTAGDGNCALDVPNSSNNFILGRSEGMPARGMNPTLTKYRDDVDRLYTSLGSAHQYYLASFNRDGPNGIGGLGVFSDSKATVAAAYADYAAEEIIGRINCPNALFTTAGDGRLIFCQGLVSSDIVGHEYTHAVTYHSIVDATGFPSGFVYQGESGALDEGFADVFGEAIERSASGNNDWMMGTGAFMIFRDLNNPEAMFSPSSTFSPHYECGSDDRGGVHTNSTVLSYIAKLLASGGNAASCQISAIGAVKQQAIFYRALTHYLHMASGFREAYNALLYACFDLYGENSVECTEVGKALNASLMNQGSRCLGAGSPAVDCDLCPLDPLKSSPGVCGCGSPDIDSDANGDLDCKDPAIETLVPKVPKLIARGRAVKVLVSDSSGIRKLLRVVVNSKNPTTGRREKQIFEYEVAQPSLRIKNLPRGARVTASLFFFVDEKSARRLSQESARARVKLAN